ncbi:MAG: hypothetical protein M3R54_05320 [Chloroflexota bacterium]|nr:hypothetical protein [Chloroflexota bacterium]
MVFNAIYVFPELIVRVPSNNDDAFHFLWVQRASDALARGENPFDFWTPQLELGFATFVHYQNLPHLAVVAVHRLLFGLVDLFTLFNVVRYLLLVSFPVTVLWSMRRMGFSLAQSAFAAAAASLLSTPFLYGFDYASYVWRGFGTYTQLWGMHLSFIGLAAMHTVIVRGHGQLLAIAALSILVLSHLLYAYILAITIGVLFLLCLRRSQWRLQLRDVAIVGAFTLVITAYMWLPYLQYGAYLSVSPYLQPEKYDGLGAQKVLGYLVSGELFDSGRLPIFTELLGLGIVFALIRRTRLAVIPLTLFVVWLVLYFGRPTLGALVDLLPLHQTLYIHRFSGGVHLAGIMLIGVGAAWLWEAAARSWRPWLPYAAALAAMLALIPAITERAAFYVQNLEWMQQTRAAIDVDTDARAILDTLRTLPPARTFAGLRTDYGPRMNFAIPFNSVRFSDVLTFERIDAVSPPYNSLSLSSDMLWDFNYQRAEDYDLFNVRYVLAPAAEPMPSFLTVAKKTARYTLYQAPSSGYGEYVRVTAREAVATSPDLVRADRAWLLASDRTARGYIQWDYPARQTAGAAPNAGCVNGVTGQETVSPGRIDLVARCETAGTLLLKVTYDPGWQVTVDGTDTKTFMVSPAYVGVSVPAGTHAIAARYQGAPLKMPLLGVGLLAAALAVPVCRRLRGHA